MATDTPLPKKVLVFGATGLIGKYIIQELYNARSSFEKIGFFTSKTTVENKADEVNEWKEKGVEIIVGDVNSEDDVNKAYEGYDTVVSALGRNAILSQVPLLKVAESSPTIKYFYPSEYGTDIEYGPSSAAEKPHQLKLQVRKYIREHTKKLKVTYLVTGPYSDLYFGPAGGDERVGSFNLKERKATLLGNGSEQISFTTMKDVGRLFVAALETPATAHERILKVNSFTTTGKEALAEFEEQTGAKWEVSYTSLEELKRLEEEAWEKDSPIKTVFTLHRIWLEGGTLYKVRSNGEIGFEGKEERLKEHVQEIIAKHD
ncbi:NAD(P)-binding protein [Cucurbitaria berberidis CBS 394.84]|uniref:NAD(P)-binding protein n=1 Tax=Cucurbitaria berberidis CBS 394.84 TaxID=1168544 RepID=A0A9P4GE06_9PLEO|nr:NAD(P)-binding protein [Cucurbitaria berberidis CBS 394.84]KAF1843781.1 NAD(P)-binding protein [Cucurbitaria berberidis CBS 394.84]